MKFTNFHEKLKNKHIFKIIDSLFREKENIFPDKIDIIGHTKNGDITDEVDVIFIFKRYRFVFLFDLSSSAIRVNRLTSMVIVDEMLEAFEILLENLLKDYQVPGQFDEKFITPEVFCTLIGFLGEENGHVVFEQDRLGFKIRRNFVGAKPSCSHKLLLNRPASLYSTQFPLQFPYFEP